MKLSSGLLSTLLLIDPALGGKKNKNRSDSGLTGNQKLKKLLRDGFEITDFMYKAPVFDAAEGRGPTDERAPDDRCNPKNNKCEPDKLTFEVITGQLSKGTMINIRLYNRIITKYFNQFKYLIAKFNSAECDKYGSKDRPPNDDFESVWLAENAAVYDQTTWEVIKGERQTKLENFKQTINLIQHENNEAVKALGQKKSDLEDLLNENKYKDQTRKLLEKLDKVINGLAPDDEKAVRGISTAKEGESSPITSLMAVYERMHLWITDFLQPCYDESVANSLIDKTDGKKVKNKNAPERVRKWAEKGHKKLQTLQKRVCMNVVAGRIRVVNGDNPFEWKKGADFKSGYLKARPDGVWPPEEADKFLTKGECKYYPYVISKGVRKQKKKDREE
jgi:hypothetical protein